MSLRGNIKEFNISEIFQILSMGHKTGVLKIKNDEEGCIYFKNGEGYYATSTRYRKPIGLRLVEAGLIRKGDLDKALEAQKGKYADRRIGRILLEMGLIETGALESFIKEQIWDAFLDILSWEEGEFEFEVGAVPTEEDIGITFEAWNKVVTGIPSFENVVKSEQWTKIKEDIPDFDLVFVLDQSRAADVVGISLAPNEWGLVCLIDGKRTVAELVKQYGGDSFQAGYTLHKLLKAGLITRVAQSTSPMSEVGLEEKAVSEREKADEAVKAKTAQISSKPDIKDRQDKEGRKEEVGPEAKESVEPAEVLLEQAVDELESQAGVPEQPMKIRAAESANKEVSEEKVAQTPAKRDNKGKQEKEVIEESAVAKEEKIPGHLKPAEGKLEAPVEKSMEKELAPVGSSTSEAEATGKNKEVKKGSAQRSSEKEVSNGSIEIRALGNLEVWVGKEKRFADLFIIRKGEKASNVLRYPDGKYQFVHDRFSAEEKKVILEEISAKK